MAKEQVNYEHLKDKYDALQYQYMKLTLTHNHVKTGIVDFLKLILKLRKTADTMLKKDPHDEKALFMVEMGDNLTKIYEKNFREAVEAHTDAEDKATTK